ncbi:ECF transporter S component, partial [Kitasatospora sp. NPDC058263]
MPRSRTNPSRTNRTPRAGNRPVPLGRRSIATLLLTSSVGVAAFGWPLLAATDSALVGHSTDAPW